MLATKQYLDLELDLDLGNDTSSVWSFCARFSDVISRGIQWWRRKMSAVFSEKNNSGLVQSRTAFQKLSVVLTFATIFLPNIGSRCYDL